jgi:hypothetical protein
MKRIGFIWVFLVAFTMAKAQQETGLWTLTPKVGVNSSKVSVNDLWVMMQDDNNELRASAKRRWGFVGGVDAEYQAWQQIGVSVGAFFSTEGYTYGDIKDIGKVSQSLYYLNVPVLVNFYIEPNILPGLALKAGIQVGYLLKGEHTSGSTETNTDNYKRVNVSIPAGISYSYRGFVADLRYNIGISNLCNMGVLDESWKLNSLWLTLGYQFKL